MLSPDGPLLSWGFLLLPGFPMACPPPAPAAPSLSGGSLPLPVFPMACLASAIEPLRAANEITGRADFSWTLVGEEAGPVRSSAGVGFDTDLTLGEISGDTRRLH